MANDASGTRTERERRVRRPLRDAEGALFGRRGTPPDRSQREPGGRCRSAGLVVAALVQDRERPTTVPLLRENPGAGLMGIGAVSGLVGSW
jgi:hypothetical protein